MIFKSVELNNFRSFNGKHVFSLDNPSGFYFLTGENKVDEDLEANGSGKSTLWESIYWCLKGKTLRGLKAGDLKNWSSDESYSVKLNFYVNNTNYQLFRGWKPNKLQVSKDDGKFVNVSQEEVDELTLNDRAFQNSIMIGQFTDVFVDLKPVDKLSLFSDILDLDFWLEKSQEASDDLKETKELIDNIDYDLSLYQSSRKKTEEQIESNTKDYEEFDNSVKEETSRLKTELKEEENKKEEIKKKAGELNKEVKKLENREEKVSDKINEVVSLRQELFDSYIELRTERDKVKYEVDKNKEELAKFKEVEDVCPYCNQDVNEDHLQSEIKKLTSTLKSKEKELKDYEGDLEDIGTDLTYVEEQEGKLNEKFAEIIELKSAKANEISKLDREVSLIDSNLRRINKDLEKEINKKNPYKKIIEKAKEDLNYYKEEEKKLNSSKKELNKKQEIYNFWVKGFKEIRMYLIQESLIEFELEVNNNLSQMGLGNWEISFDMERETKSGTVSKGFQMLVRSPQVDNYAPWEAWSGGEAQRVRLAVVLGLSNLILSRKGIKTNLLVLDEPTQHLSESGIEDLLSLLPEKSKRDEKQIWLVDHHSMQYGGFDGVMKVVKDQEGSRIEEVS